MFLCTSTPSDYASSFFPTVSLVAAVGTVRPCDPIRTLIVSASTVVDTANKRGDSVRLNQATTSASVVAVMYSLTPQHNLNANARKMHAHPGFNSRSLSQLPLFPDPYRRTQSEDNSSAAKEEMMALLRSRSSTSSSEKSRGSSAQSHLISPGGSSTPTPSSSPQKTPPQFSTSTPARNTSKDTSNDASFASINTLSPRARRALLRSARKVGNILGETPVLCTTQDSIDARPRTADSSELGRFPSSSPATVAYSLKRTNSFNTQTRPRQTAEMGFAMYDGLASAFVAPHQHKELSVHHAPEPPAPLLNRAPPILKVDCSLVAETSKNGCQGSSAELTPDTDAKSFVSTTTTTSLASDVFSPTSRRGSISPIDARLTRSEREKDKVREARRMKVAKLTRHLGEYVPADLVFPPDKTEPFVLVSYERTSPVSPLANKSPQKKVIEPPMRSSSLRRRTRKSLHLEVTRSPSTTGSLPSTGSSTAMSPFGSASSKYRPARGLSRSHSVRVRTRKCSSPDVPHPSIGTDAENERTYPASAPAAQTVHETGDGRTSEQRRVTRKEEHHEKDKRQASEPRSPLNDAQRAINVRRAQKILSVFGEAPPNELLSHKPVTDPSGALGRGAFAGAMFKRHSISSIMTSSSTFMDFREPATFDSPISPITPKAKYYGEASRTPTSASKDGLKPSTPATPHRRASLSALPDTPPPFSQYFATEAPPSPISPSAVCHQSSHQSVNTSGMSRPPAMTHLPPTSTSSASPSTPGSGAQENLGAVFRERRLRAAKLSRFFGVGYGDLFPAEDGTQEDARPSSGSFDSARGLQRESGDREDNLTHVSVTVQRESDGEHASSSSCASSSASASPELKNLPTLASPTDWDGGAAGCYGNLGFGSGLTPNWSPSARRRRGVGTGPRQNGVGMLAAFSLGRHSRGSKMNNVVRNSLNVTLGRKGSTCSTAKTAGARALPVENRRSILSRSGSTEFGVASGLEKLEREPTYVRVGQKVADVNEVMGKLRELR